MESLDGISLPTIKVCVKNKNQNRKTRIAFYFGKWCEFNEGQIIPLLWCLAPGRLLPASTHQPLRGFPSLSADSDHNHKLLHAHYNGGHSDVPWHPPPQHYFGVPGAIVPSCSANQNGRLVGCEVVLCVHVWFSLIMFMLAHAGLSVAGKGRLNSSWPSIIARYLYIFLNRYTGMFVPP